MPAKEKGFPGASGYCGIQGTENYFMNIFKGSYTAAALFLALILQGGMLYGDDSGNGAYLPDGISLHLSQRAGILYGVMGEYVYSGGEKISELNWDMKPLYIFQFLGTLSIYEKYYFSLRYRYGIPWKSGSVTDTDWDLPVPGSITFSKHEGVTLLYHEIEGAFSATLLSRRSIIVRGGLSYLVMAMKVEARNGTVYVDGSQTDALNGPVMRYFQGYQIVPFRVDVFFRPLSALSAGFSFAYTPLLFCSATDMHFLKDTQYDDRIDWGHFIEVSLETAWHVTTRVDLFIGGQFRWVPPTMGDSRKITISTGFKYSWTNSTAGISLLQGSFSLGATLHFNFSGR